MGCSSVHDDRKLFEFLILEGAQAGLSWTTIVKKRDGYRLAFDDFNPALVACFDEQKKQWLRQNSVIVRNHLKIEAATVNAQSSCRFRKDLAILTPISGNLLMGSQFKTIGHP